MRTLSMILVTASVSSPAFFLLSYHFFHAAALRCVAACGFIWYASPAAAVAVAVAAPSKWRTEGEEWGLLRHRVSGIARG